MSSRLFTRMHRKLNFPSVLTSTSTSAEYGTYKHEALNWNKSTHHTRHKNKHKHQNGHGAQAAPSITPAENHVKPHGVEVRSNGNDLHTAATAVDHFDFEVVSFNLLAPVYKRLTTKNAQTGRRHREAGSYELWSERLQQTVDFFKQEIYTNTAIIALQEYWLDVRYRKVFEEQFAAYGYDFRIMQRTGTKVDAVALVIKKDMFEIKGAEYIDLATLGDRVALLLWLKHKHTGHDLLVANTHLSFPHNPTDQMNQVMQMQHLTSVIDRYARVHDIAGAPALIMGDFNVEGRSLVCDHLRSAGYFSCFEVCPPANCPVSEYSTVHPQDTFVRNTATATAATAASTAAAAITNAGDSAHDRAGACANIAQYPAEGLDESGRAVETGVESMRVGECDDVGDNCVDAHAVAEEASQLDASVGTTGTAEDSTNGPSDFAAHYPAAENTEFRSVTYVSHFNHRSEEVGVDHIFIKPTSATFAAVGNNDFAASEPREEKVTTEEPLVSKTAEAAAAAHQSGTRNPNSSTSSSRAADKGVDKEVNKGVNKGVPQVFVAECQVLPATVSCTSWFKQFRISDHRPVRTKIVLARPEPEHS